MRLPILHSILAAALLAAGPAAAQTLLFDFGGNNTTATGPAPDDPVNAWNNIIGAIGLAEPGTPAALLSAAVDITNTPTDVNFEILARFNGVNENGTQASGAFPPDATRDSMYGNTETFGAGADFYPSFRLSGLNPAANHNLTFYASRMGVGDNRQTLYTVSGATEVEVTLNAANNEVGTVVAELIKPNAEGEIVVTLGPGPENDNANHFTYLGVMKLDIISTQTPIVITGEPEDFTAIQGRPAVFSATVSGTPPYNIQWKRNGTAIEGATQLSYTIPAVTADMNNTRYSVTVSNLEFSATSREALLTVNTDDTPPAVASASSAGPWRISLEFSEEVDETTAADPFNYSINDGAVFVTAAVLLADRKTVVLTPDIALDGSAAVTINNVSDLAGNSIAANTAVTVEIPQPDGQSILIDFGGDTTEQGGGNDDPLNFWNNISGGTAAIDGGFQPDLFFNDGNPGPVSLTIVNRFNGVNTAGTQSPLAPFPVDATRDTVFGNTELFGELENVFPVIRLGGLDPLRDYDLVIYASRMEAGDNRETRYTITGAVETISDLNPSNNIGNSVNLTGIRPDGAGEITIALTPGPNNNNSNHFTYLGAMKITPQASAGAPPVLLNPVLSNGKVVVSWTGNGTLETSATLTGAWTPVTPAPASPYSEDIVPGQRKFFRLRP